VIFQLTNLDLVHLPGIFKYDIISILSGTKQIVVTSPMAMLNLEHQANNGGGHASSLSLSTFPVNTSITPVNTLPFFSLIQGTSIIQAFSWATAIDWTTLSRAMPLDQQLVRSLPPDPSQLRSMSYSQQQTSLITTWGPDVLFLRYIVSCLINNVKPSQHEDLAGIYQWLANFPKAAAVKFFTCFPTEILDVVRQRFRVYAASDDNPNTVQAILALEYDLNTSSSYSLHEISKLLESLSRYSCDASVAQILVRFASFVYADQDSILQKLLVIFGRRPSHQPQLGRTDWFLLMKIPLLAGAAPTSFCFDLVPDDVFALQEFLEMTKIDILTWFERDLLATTMSNRYYEDNLQTKIDWALKTLSEAISSRIINCSWTDELQKALSAAFSRAFSVSLQRKKSWTTATLYGTCQHLNLTLDLSQYDRRQSDEMLRSCRAGDWIKACTAASKKISSKTSFADLTEAIAKDDHHRIKRELGTTPGWPPVDEILKALELAITSGSDNVAAIIAARTPQPAVLRLLEHGQICAISKMLSEHSHWAGIMQDAIPTGHYEHLEDVLYLAEIHQRCLIFPCQLIVMEVPQRHAVMLRILGYHAMYTRNLQLLDWLCKRDLAVGAVVIQDGDEEMMLPLPEQRRERLHDHSETSIYGIRLPSLVDVAVQHNDLVLMNYFHSRTLPHRNSDALLHAVRANVHSDTIEYLIEQAGIEAAGVRTQYGSAALRVAIRNRNYDVIRMLAKSTDIHGLEAVDRDCSAIDGYLDPLGEAILLNDIEAVSILLDNGGNPNALVAFEGLLDRTPCVVDYSVLMRLTALLVAIDVGSLALVKFLVERGADVNRRLEMGLLRNPLQRAAEIGDFQMVELLIENNAIVDAEPAFGGGTALQLAAMSGHVGIAAFLIERGADVNHPPARGPGRTAFEAAAEWCRPDVMYLLVQHGAQLDLEVTGEDEIFDYPSDDEILDDSDDEPEMQWHTVKWSASQYTRALDFAEERQEFASMNIVRSLYDEVTRGTES
jgi:ankyrin repeat protein